ncbi:hypothetical protein [Asticcacaulis sp. AND118]|uniref:hypothetical protein n=1 Tax=Asticcacaulis sp. AND118 TaxID=2840468 RepID=UPI001CFF7D42|nr:hypothetical protein [Asticcacaulis sp. AND118]UDF04179.1 hypothetical protein LH365_03810 [Asticcacaulis sp. AND118]
MRTFIITLAISLCAATTVSATVYPGDSARSAWTPTSQALNYSKLYKSAKSAYNTSLRLSGQGKSEAACAAAQKAVGLWNAAYRSHGVRADDVNERVRNAPGYARLPASQYQRPEMTNPYIDNEASLCTGA